MIFSLIALQAKAQDFQSTMEKAEEAASLGNFVDAERHWLRAIHFSSSENRFEPSFGLGKALLGQNRYREAALQLDFAADLAPNDSLRAICLLRESAALLQISDLRRR